jgi:hypothetical protein
MRTLLLLGITLAAAACGGDHPTIPASPSVVGSYQLTMVDGNQLPFTILDLGTYRANLASGTLTLSGDGTYLFKVGYQLDDGLKIRASADSDAGTWSAAGDAISLASTHGDVARSGTASSNGIRLQSSARVLEFRR